MATEATAACAVPFLTKMFTMVQQDSQPEGGHSQMIGPVAAIHKAGEGIAYLLEKVHKSASIPSIYKTIHCILQENSPQVKTRPAKFTEWSRFGI